MEWIEPSPVFTMAEVLARSGEAPAHSLGRSPGLSTGIIGLDGVLGGLEPGTLTVIASRPGVGRSTLLQNICQWNAGGTLPERTGSPSPVPVFLASLELSTEQIAVRAMATAGRVPRQRIRSGELDDEDKQRLQVAEKVLMAAPLYVAAPEKITVEELGEHARRMVRERGVELVGVDGLEALRGQNRQPGDLADELKALARELGTPLVVTARLAPGLQRAPGMPSLGEVCEPVAFIADTLVLVHREDLYASNTPRAGEADLFVAKARGTKPGVAPQIAFQGHYARFVDYTVA
ncbi:MULTISPECIES: replicative DNA helicase [Actinomycetes]|uniref:SF4 helicase domain-containing protein n=1 Tax=Streptomyces similanensis TaxID=1274988 RepID=A0ABP9LPE4_9ACTN